MQSSDVLFHCIGTDFIHRIVGEGENQAAAVAGKRGFRQQFLQLGQGFVECSRILEGHAQAIVFLYNFTNTHLLAAQFAADIAGIAFKGFLQSGFHVHLHSEMYAAAQIKAEEHRVGTEFGHPFRAIGHQIECGDIAVAQGLLDHVAGFDLCFGIVETDF